MTIILACKDGDLAWLQKQKELGELSDLHERECDGWFPYQYAVANGHLDVLKFVLREINRPADTSIGATVLRSSVWNNHFDIVRWILEDSTQAIDAASFRTGIDADAQRHKDRKIAAYLDAAFPLILAVGLENFRAVSKQRHVTTEQKRQQLKL